MPARLFRLYQRKRIINIHVNAVIAGMLAIALAKMPVRWVGAWVGEEHHFINSLIAYAIDSCFDVAVYFALHWIANHWSPLKPLNEADRKHQSAKKPNFLRDVATVQAERIALVPVFAAVSIGGMWALQKYWDWQTSWAFVVAFLSGIVITRLLHTVLGYWTGTFRDHHEREGTGGHAVADASAPTPGESPFDEQNRSRAS